MLVYVITFINSSGKRVMAHDNNGRHVFFKEDDAYFWLGCMLENTAKIVQIFGENPQFEVTTAYCNRNSLELPSIIF